MPDNPNNPNPPNNPPHVPTLADKQIDLSAFQLMDFDQEEIRNLPKPRTDFAEVARQVLALYPDFEAALKLTDADFDPDKVAGQLDLADQLQPYSEWLLHRTAPLDTQPRQVYTCPHRSPSLATAGAGEPCFRGEPLFDHGGIF